MEHIELNPEHKVRRARLATALRSGKFRQGAYKLKSANGCYCAMGVAAELSGLGTWAANKEGHYNFQLENQFGELGYEGLYSIGRHYGLNPEEVDDIMIWNDMYVTRFTTTHPGKSFSQLADWLESL